jgi:ATP-dependent RNA helicase MSS116, mitochondrial
MNHIKVFVLDEADQMLEMGFKPAIKEIISFLPKDRQTLLFSATVPPSLIKVANIAVKPDYKFINTIPVNEQQTHKKVPQECQIVKFKDYFLAIFCAIQSELKRNPSNFKIMVFLGTTGFTSFMADFYR